MGLLLPGCDTKPVPRPSVTGRRIERAGEAKTADGNVREGI